MEEGKAQEKVKRMQASGPSRRVRRGGKADESPFVKCPVSENHRELVHAKLKTGGVKNKERMGAG